MLSPRSGYDVLVVGAGPAGASLARLLARAGRRCLLVDKQAQPTRTLGEALKPVGRALLAEHGLSPDLRGMGAVPTFVTRVSWAGRRFEKAAVASPFGPELHVDRARFDAWLQQVACAAGADFCAPATLRSLERENDGYRVLLRTGEQDVPVEARYVVDASGRSAFLGRKLGARRAAADELVGYGRWYCAPRVEPLVVIEAASDGWWYSAPTPPDGSEARGWNAKATREQGRLVALFITDPRCPAKARRDGAWQELLRTAPATRERLAGAIQDGAPRSYLAGPAITDWAPGQRWLPVGDAALSFDPIAADGLCFALRSSLEAATHVDAELAGRPISDAYRAAIRLIYDEHLSRRLEHYRAEANARDLSFWQRRLELGKDASPIRSRALVTATSRDSAAEAR